MNTNEVEAVVLEILGKVLKSEVSRKSARSNMLQWDSLKHIEFVFALEDKLALQFTEEEVIVMDSVDRAVDCVMTRYAA